jgi:predicted transcriptional regulator
MAKRMTVVFDDEELYTALKVEAARRHVPAKDIVAEALREWIQLQEDLEDRQIAEERIAEYERTGESIPHEEVMRELGLTPRKARAS